MNCPECQNPHFVKNGGINENNAISAKTATINGQKTIYTVENPSLKKHSLSLSIATDFP